jgi:hypothetical protein
LILNPYMSGAEMRAILRDFGFVSRDICKPRRLARGDAADVRRPRGFLASLRSLGAHAVVVIDEAQSPPADVLDQIRRPTSATATA